MTHALTSAQGILLRQIGEGAGLPPALFRTPGWEADVALLRGLGLFAPEPGELSLTATGATLLRQHDAARGRSTAGSAHVMHAADQSITVEYRRPREAL